MSVTKEQYERYVRAIGSLSEKAREDAIKVMETGAGLVSRGFTAAEAREATIDALMGAVYKYSEGSAALACELYDALRAVELGNLYDFKALPGDEAMGVIYGVARAGIEQAVAASAGKESVANIISSAVTTAAKRVIENNCRKDPKSKGYLIVPSGPTTCAWCTMQAGRGLIFKGKKDNLYEKWHPNCDCQPMPSWGKLPKWYDPSRYEEMYRTARDAYEAGDYSDELAVRMAAQKELKGKDFNKTDGIMMVMREMHGLK